MTSLVYYGGGIASGAVLVALRGWTIEAIIVLVAIVYFLDVVARFGGVEA